jgi:nucleoid-associated protein YgaU
MHVIKAGETLWGIAIARYGDMAMALTIADYNGITDMQRIRVGQMLRLP